MKELNSDFNTNQTNANTQEDEKATISPLEHGLEQGEAFYFGRPNYYNSANSMSEPDLPLSIFHMLEKNVGKKVRVILDPAYGFEGTLVAITHSPAGIWLSEAEAVVLRATIAQPIPQVASRQEMSEIFLHLNSVQRIEVLHSTRR